MKENLERASQGAAELSDDMLGFVSGGAGQTPDSVDEVRQRLMDMADMAEQYKAAQEGSGKSKADSGSAYQDAFQNAMKQGLFNSQL